MSMPWHICKSQSNVEELIISFCHVVTRVWSLVIRLVSKSFYPSSHLTSPICSSYFYYVWPFYCERMLIFVKCPSHVYSNDHVISVSTLFEYVKCYILYLNMSNCLCMHALNETNLIMMHDLNVSNILSRSFTSMLTREIDFSALSSSGFSINARQSVQNESHSVLSKYVLGSSLRSMGFSVSSMVW